MDKTAKTQDMSNPQIQLANDFVRHTSSNIFLTGKAGTGKTTFLHELKKHPPKRMIVTAPTGVAAINAGGVTLHSFFQLPFGPYVSDSEVQQRAEQRRFSKEKINIIRGLDLLVIDEISMVRADLLDGVDAVLRRYKNRQLPFGGVQLLMIGDLHQLPPVVKADEWAVLKQYYRSYYFFGSIALQQTDMVSIELQYIYRQSDARFIRLLNRVRDNRLDSDTLEALNSRYLPDFQPGDHDDYITLTTHNRGADNINEGKLQALTAKPYTFQADIEGDYPEYNYPTAAKLTLKVGAQVMFVRNDSSTNKLYFNGKIGKITHIDRHHVRVQCPGDEDDIPVERVSWENIKYTLDEKTKEITEEVIGKFSQLPLRLAWAITIHKSQGLTFERAVIDANAAFSHGQVYVALSRCKSFEGLVLTTPITSRAIKTDATVAQFTDQAVLNSPSREQLHGAKILYQQNLLLQCFDYQPLVFALKKLTRLLRSNHPLILFTPSETLDNMEMQVVEEVVNVSAKFKRQLQSLFQQDAAPQEDAHIQERVRKASRYFNDKLQTGLNRWLSEFRFDSDNKEIKKQIRKALESLQRSLSVKTAALQSCRAGFSVSDYLTAIAQAEIDVSLSTSVKQTGAGEESAADVKYPQLLEALKAWRAQQAGEEGVDHYRILHQRVLVQIATVLPDTPAALRRINGIGKRTAEKYGEPLIKIVADFCREHAIQPQSEPQELAVEDDAKKDSKRTSYELYLQGKSVQEIAAERGLATSTIEGHLVHYVGMGKLDIAEFVPGEKIIAIKTAAADTGVQSLKAIKDSLGDKFSYSEIRMVLETLR